MTIHPRLLPAYTEKHKVPQYESSLVPTTAAMLTHVSIQ